MKGNQVTSTSPSSIPAEAIEAAHKAWRAQAAQPGTIFEYNLQAALEAAAPHLMAQAWDEGRDALADFDHRQAGPYPTNPYRSQQ